MMTRLVWLSDLHLDFVKSEADIVALCDRVAGTGADIVLLGGDTGTAATLGQYLLLLERTLRRPIYFVLGNHDFCGSSISAVREMARDLCRRELFLDARFARLGALGDEAAAYFRQLLPDALTHRRRIVLLAHVPPFREAWGYQGRISNDEALPHFACGVVGDVLVEIMSERPDCHLTVPCGHTHSEGVAQILPNLTVRTATAEYGAPQPQADWTLQML